MCVCVCRCLPQRVTIRCCCCSRSLTSPRAINIWMEGAPPPPIGFEPPFLTQMTASCHFSSISISCNLLGIGRRRRKRERKKADFHDDFTSSRLQTQPCEHLAKNSPSASLSFLFVFLFLRVTLSSASERETARCASLFSTVLIGSPNLSFVDNAVSRTKESKQPIWRSHSRESTQTFSIQHFIYCIILDMYNNKEDFW